MTPRIAGVVALCLLLMPRAPRASQEITMSTLDLLDYYELGQPDAVARALVEASHGDLGVALGRLKKESPAWMLEAGPKKVDHRREVLATFSLEVASAGLDNQWVRSEAILEWACDLLRQQKAVSPFEREWHLAALALIEGSRDLSALRIHMAHMGDRVPDEPRLLLARAFVEETLYWDDVWKNAQARIARQIVPGSSAWSPGADADDSRRALESARQRPENRREAALRLGYFALADGRPERALALLDGVGPGDDAGQMYLANLFTGWAHGQLGHEDDAIRAFRAAIAAVPNAQAAALALAARLLAQGHREEAAELAQGATDVGSGQVDPWRQYGYGDWRRLPDLLNVLRRRLR